MYLPQLSTETYRKFSNSSGSGTTCADDHNVFMEVHGHYLCSVKALQELISNGVDQDRYWVMHMEALAIVTYPLS